MKTASHSDHPLKGHGRFCVSHLDLSIVYFNLHWNMHLFVDLIFKRSYLAFECSDLYGIFSFKSFGQKHVFLIKIQRFLEFHHYISLFLR